LFPAIVAFSAIGIYSGSNSSVELYLAALFGVLGFVWVKLGFNLAPMLLGFVLGPLLEENLRRAMLVARGDPMVFFIRPISLCFMVVTVLILVFMLMPALRRKHEIRGD
jgi:putative tricarboxylic transport membrane protein